CFQTNGVAQLLFSSRSTRHSSLPLRASRATRSDFSSLSLTTNSLPSCRAGELPVPQPMRVLRACHFCFQSSLPSLSKQATPTLPKQAQTRSPSVTGVSEAGLFLMCRGASGLPANASRVQRTLPERASRQWTSQRCSPGGTLPLRSLMYRPFFGSSPLASLVA